MNSSGPQLECIECDHLELHGHVFWQPGKLSIARDQTIPQWGMQNEHFQIDPIPEAIWMNQPVRQRGRVNMLLISEGIYALDKA